MDCALTGTRRAPTVFPLTPAVSHHSASARIGVLRAAGVFEGYFYPWFPGFDWSGLWWREGSGIYGALTLGSARRGPGDCHHTQPSGHTLGRGHADAGVLRRRPSRPPSPVCRPQAPRRGALASRIAWWPFCPRPARAVVSECPQDVLALL